MLEHTLNLFVKAVFVENMALAFFLGMCSFLACSKKVSNSIGLGVAVTFVLVMTTPLNCLVYRYFLQEGAMVWLFGDSMKHVDLEFITFITCIGSIAAATQVVEMFLERYVPALYATLGIFLPLIAVNCAILGNSLFMVERKLTVGDSVIFALGGGVGWALAIVALAAIREKMRYSNVPYALRGLGMAFMLTGLMAVAFMSLSGIQL